MNKLIFFIMILLFSLPVFAQRGVKVQVFDQQGGEVMLYENSYALVIGNSRYLDAGWNTLPGVRDDVKAVSSILCRHHFNVEIAEDLTSKNFEMRIKAFIDKYGKSPKNRILIYYAGHGYKQKSNGDARQIGYVVPVDAPSPRNPAFINYALTMNTIENYARQIQSTHALFVFDNCYSGKLLSRSNIVVPAKLNREIGGAVRQFLTSGSAEQEVPDQSEFRRAFTRGLEGAADNNRDGYTTASELAIFIGDALKGQAQSPQYGKIKDPELSIGDFVFARPDGAECVGNGSSSDESAELSSPKVETNFFKFELKSCKLAGSSFECLVDVTNNEADRSISFSRKTAVYDELGNVYLLKRAAIGLKYADTAYYPLINGVTVTVRLRFDNFSPNARQITKLAIYVGQPGRTPFPVEFRKVPLSEQTGRNLNAHGRQFPSSEEFGSLPAVLSSGRQRSRAGIDGNLMAMSSNANSAGSEKFYGYRPPAQSLSTEKESGIDRLSGAVRRIPVIPGSHEFKSFINFER